MLARYERNCPKKKNNVGANGSNRGQDFFRLTQSDPENWYESPLNSTFLNLFFWLAGRSILDRFETTNHSGETYIFFDKL